MENNDIIYDKEESLLLQSIEQEEWKSTNNSEEVEDMFTAAISNYRKKQKKIHLAIDTENLYRIRRICTKKGISTESLINALIHNYVNGSISLNL